MLETERSGQSWQILGGRTCRCTGGGDRKGGIKADVHVAYITSQEAVQFTELRNSLKRAFLSSYWCYTIHKGRDD